MATWDQIGLGTWDQLWTWDDPDRDIAIDAAYAMGEVTVDAAELTVDWAGDVPADLLQPTSVRDEFAPLYLATDSYARLITAGIGSTDQGGQYTISGGSASEYSVDGSRYASSVTSLNTPRYAILAGVNALNFDFTIRFDVSAAPTGTGNIEHGIQGRRFDASNLLDFRMFRDVATNSCTIALRQTVGGVPSVTSFIPVPSALPGDAIYVRFAASGSSMSGYAWRVGDAKPSAPLVTMTGLTMLSPGSFRWYNTTSATLTNTLPIQVYSSALRIVSGDLTQTSVDRHPYAFQTSPADSQLIAVSADGYATYRPAAVNVESLALITDVVEADFDLLFRVRATALFTGGPGHLALYARYQDSSNFLRLRLDFNVSTVMGFGIERVSGGVATTLASGLIPEFQHTTTRWIYFRVQGFGSVIRLKSWDAAAQVVPGWIAYAEDALFASVAGKMGWGGFLESTNTNALPYLEFQIDQFWMGANSALDSGQVSVGLSLDDGMPSEVTNTSNIGVNEASADLLGPIGTSPDIFFSTFRTDQPYADMPRDTGGVAITGQVLTGSGVRPVRVFTGRMTDIPLDNLSAKMTGVSATRLALSTPIQPPAVHGYYEGGEATWAIAYALFKCGVYVAPKPPAGCRLYLPFNGTTHSYIPDTNSGSAPFGGTRYIASGVPVYDRPKWIDGPFTAAPDLHCDPSGVRKVITGPGVQQLAPGEDFLSQNGYRGRIEAWVKGIPTDAAGSLNPAQGDLFMVRVHNPSLTRYAALLVLSTRQVRIQIADGTTAVGYIHSQLPIDNQWHYIAGDWDIGPSSVIVRVRMDGLTRTYGGGVSNAALPLIEDATIPDMQTCLPVAEVRVSSGYSATKAPWLDTEPFEPGAIIRRSILTLDGIAETAPREAFELLSSYAQSELARTGFDRQDRFQYLPLTYWAEPNQQIVEETLSTDSNIGKDFRPVRDVKKTFNDVVLSYKDSQVQENWSVVYQSSLLLVVPPGQAVYVEAPFSAPVIELRGLTFAVMSGAALAATPPSASNVINYLTLNDALDGTGAYATAVDLSASVASWNPGSARILIKNSSSKTWYLANNVNLPPIGLAAKTVQVLDASIEAIQIASVAQRGRRHLPVSMPVIQNRADAQRMAEILASLLASPRVTITTDVLPDARREPGRLYQVTDSDGTGISRTFRLTGSSMGQDGANVQQVLGLEEAWPIAIWGQTNWGEGVWGP